MWKIVKKSLILSMTRKNAETPLKRQESGQECLRCKIVLQKCRKSAQRNQDTAYQLDV